MESATTLKKQPITIPIEKTPTRIPGLDEILEGGLPRGRTTVIKGRAGSGKTVMGLEFLYRGALDGEPGIFVGFEEPTKQVRQNCASMGWDLSELERKSKLFLLEGHLKPDTLLSGDFSLKGLLAVAAGKSKEMGAKRIVIDALEVVLRLFDTPQQVRNEMNALNDWLQSSGLAVILTVRPPSKEGTSAYEDFFDSMADCVINMDTRVSEQVSTRRLRVVKYRGSGFGRNEYPYVISRTGVHATPISTVGLRHEALGEKINTGNERLNDILDGGFRRSSCILLAGMPGAGKTILASTFVAATCEGGEVVLYIGFEESEGALIENVLSAGVSLQPYADSGRLSFLTSFPESMGAEEHYVRALESINTLCPSCVVIDAISACLRMGGKLASFEYLMRIFNTCKEQDITLMLINQMDGSSSRLEISGNGISSMVDTLIFLNYHEGFGETNRLMQVLKARGSNHSNQKREFEITDDGITILDVYTGTGDVLTGMARKQQDIINEAEAQLLTYEIQAVELQLKKLLLLKDKTSLEKKTRRVNRNETLTGTEISSTKTAPSPPDSDRREGDEP